MAKHTRDRKRIVSAISTVSMFFAKRKPNSKGVWKNITDINIRQPLIDRIYDPSKISQSNTNTCGPTSYVYALANRCPDLYTQLVLDMYSKGKSKLGGITFNPDTSTQQSWAPQSTRIAAVDWVVIAGVKNTTTPDFDNPDESLDGITMPGELAKWLEKTGWKIQAQKASIWGAGIDKMKAASQAYISGRTVFLFVKAKSIGNVSKGLWWGVDHWIVLSSSIEVRESNNKTWKQLTDQSLNGKNIDNYQIRFEAYTWGDYESIGVKNSTSTIKINDVDDFNGYYYGYVAADPPR